MSTTSGSALEIKTGTSSGSSERNFKKNPVSVRPGGRSVRPGGTAKREGERPKEEEKVGKVTDANFPLTHPEEQADNKLHNTI